QEVAWDDGLLVDVFTQAGLGALPMHLLVPGARSARPGPGPEGSPTNRPAPATPAAPATGGDGLVTAPALTLEPVNVAHVPANDNAVPPRTEPLARPQAVPEAAGAEGRAPSPGPAL